MFDLKTEISRIEANVKETSNASAINYVMRNYLHELKSIDSFQEDNKPAKEIDIYSDIMETISGMRFKDDRYAAAVKWCNLQSIKPKDATKLFDLVNKGEKRASTAREEIDKGWRLPTEDEMITFLKHRKASKSYFNRVVWLKNYHIMSLRTRKVNNDTSNYLGIGTSYFLILVRNTQKGLQFKPLDGLYNKNEIRLKIKEFNNPVKRKYTANDCGTDNTLSKVLNTKEELLEYIGRYYITPKGLIRITNDESLIGKILNIRSPLFCESSGTICKVCNGKSLPKYNYKPSPGRRRSTPIPSKTKYTTNIKYVMFHYAFSKTQSDAPLDARHFSIRACVVKSKMNPVGIKLKDFELNDIGLINGRFYIDDEIKRLGLDIPLYFNEIDYNFISKYGARNWVKYSNFKSNFDYTSAMNDVITRYFDVPEKYTIGQSFAKRLIIDRSPEIEAKDIDAKLSGISQFK